MQALDKRVLDTRLAHEFNPSMRDKTPISDRIKSSLPGFMALAGLSVDDLAREIETDPTSIRKWMRGVMVPSFAAVDACDLAFAQRGVIGFMESLRSSQRHQGYDCAVVPLAGLRQPQELRALALLAPGLRDQPDDFKRLLAERGLADKCHIFAYANGAWRIVEIGAAMASKTRIEADVLGLDVRDFCDPDYGRFIHDNNTIALRRGVPSVEHVRGQVMEYSRAVVPVANKLLVALTYQVSRPPVYRLSSRKDQ